MAVYLDYNATTPVDSRVAKVMLPYLHKYFGNPSSSHEYGVITKRAVIKARQQVAQLIGCMPQELIFTSGGTESNNHALRGYAFANRQKGNHIITSVIEHPAILNVCDYLEKYGFEITKISVDKYGMIDFYELEKAIKPDTIMISIMHANNEVGTIQPILEIAEIAHKHNIVLHCDAAQSIGKIPVSINQLGVDLLSIAGHKLYAPKGVGALFVKDGIELENYMIGGNQEGGRRSGTENVLEIVGLGEAAEIAFQELGQNSSNSKKMRDLLWQQISSLFAGVKLNGHPIKRLPNTLNVSFPDLDEFKVLEVFTEIAASAGAACHSDDVSISPVLEAMQVPLELAKNTIRFSTGRFTTEIEVLKAVKILKSILK